MKPTVEFIPPMAAKLVGTLPDGPEWLYEVKCDGYRVEALKHGSNVRLLSRKANDLTSTYPKVTKAVAAIAADTAILDGELVALDEQGRPSFQDLQHRSSARHIVYYAFDLLHLNGEDLTALPLTRRRHMLKSVLSGSGVLFSDELNGTALEVSKAVKQLELEGIVAKRKGSRYEPANRSGAWLKVQFKRSQEFVIGGYRPEGAKLDAIAVGYYADGKLTFVGKVRGGFSPFTRAGLLKAVKPLEMSKCPFVNLPNAKSGGRWSEGISADDMGEWKWLKPKLVAQIRFTEWTRGGLLRHSSYMGLREDKVPSEVVLELPLVKRR